MPSVTIHALLFELVSPPGTYLIAWPDENGHGRWCRHSHPDKTLLDVEPGHRIVHGWKVYEVARVKPYRTSECREETRYPWVRSGREYLSCSEQRG